MSKSGRPVSLQSALVIRRAQALRERMEAAKPSAPRRTGFSLARFFGAKADAVCVEEVEPRKMAA
jgi:hypothetical protein